MDAGGCWLALLAVNAHSHLKIIGYLLGSVFTKKNPEKKQVQLSVKIKTFQEQEVNNAGVPPQGAHYYCGVPG